MSGHFLSDQTAWSDQGHSLTHRALSTPTMSRLTAAAILMIALGVAAHSGGESCCHARPIALSAACCLFSCVRAVRPEVYGVVALTSPRTILLLQECQHAHKASAPPPSQRTQCASCCAKEKVRTHASARCDLASSALSHEHNFSLPNRRTTTWRFARGHRPRGIRSGGPAEAAGLRAGPSP